MPWRTTTPMDQRMRFVVDHERGLFTMKELADRYEISRKTGYKWLERYFCEGPEGLRDRSRVPKKCPHATPPRVVTVLLDARRKHPTWGARKLLPYLEPRHPDLCFPAPSTVEEILKKHGLVKGRRRRRRPGHPGPPTTPMTAPNDVWTADFKGQFRTRNGIYCYPLTVVDGFSRYLLGCKGLLSTKHEGVEAAFLRLFRRFGLPKVIRTDNGVPFATQALGRISRLTVWWIRLGIHHELIEPSHPEQNGSHERMHRTLKAEATRPPEANLFRQQRVLDRFRRRYNQERPHEAIGQRPPARIYRPSRRPYPKTVPQPRYPSHFEVRLVSRNGGIRWNSGWLNISHVLMEEYVGLEEVDDGIWSVHFGPLLLGRFDEQELRLYGAMPPTLRHSRSRYALPHTNHTVRSHNARRRPPLSPV